VRDGLRQLAAGTLPARGMQVILKSPVLEKVTPEFARGRLGNQSSYRDSISQISRRISWSS
jgi:hypothetical protein